LKKWLHAGLVGAGVGAGSLVGAALFVLVRRRHAARAVQDEPEGVPPDLAAAIMVAVRAHQEAIATKYRRVPTVPVQCPRHPDVVPNYWVAAGRVLQHRDWRRGR